METVTDFPGYLVKEIVNMHGRTWDVRVWTSKHYNYAQSTRHQKVRTHQTKKRQDVEPPSQTSWMEDIRKWQEDPDLKIVVTWTDIPKWADTATERPKVKYYCARWD